MKKIISILIIGCFLTTGIATISSAGNQESKEMSETKWDVTFGVVILQNVNNLEVSNNLGIKTITGTVQEEACWLVPIGAYYMYQILRKTVGYNAADEYWFSNSKIYGFENGEDFTIELLPLKRMVSNIEDGYFSSTGLFVKLL